MGRFNKTYNVTKTYSINSSWTLISNYKSELENFPWYKIYIQYSLFSRQCCINNLSPKKKVYVSSCCLSAAWTEDARLLQALQRIALILNLSKTLSPLTTEKSTYHKGPSEGWCVCIAFPVGLNCLLSNKCLEMEINAFSISSLSSQNPGVFNRCLSC